MTDAVEAFVAHAVRTEWENIPEAARNALKIFLLDSLGVGIAGAATPLAASARAAARRWSGEGAAHVWGAGALKLLPAQAAFVNGVQIHCQEFDCVHEPAVVHPMATILAALLADCERGEMVSGARLGEALIVAVDMAAGLGVAATSPLKFFRPATAGIFGATLGISKCRAFSVDTTRRALGYALSFASGTMQAHTEGKPALPVQIGHAARNAIIACDLAEAGLDSAEHCLEGPYGYLKLFEESYDLEPVVNALGKSWRISEVSHKPFPTGRAAQGGIRMMQMARAKGIRASTVQRAVLSAPPLIARLVGRRAFAGMSASHARLCFAYSGAVALLDEDVLPADFTVSALQRPETLLLAERISVTTNDVTLPSAFTPQSLELFLSNGATHIETLAALPGSPADPLTRDENESKFRRCVDFGFGTPSSPLADRLIRTTNALESLPDVRHLNRLASGILD